MEDKMIAFEVYLNGEKLCLAGVGGDWVLSVIATWVSRRGQSDMFMSAGGLITETEEHIEWMKQEPLRVGDTIQIKILESQAVDPPRENSN
jgi:hypothetical protein